MNINNENVIKKNDKPKTDEKINMGLAEWSRAQGLDPSTGYMLYKRGMLYPMPRMETARAAKAHHGGRRLIVAPGTVRVHRRPGPKNKP